MTVEQTHKNNKKTIRNLSVAAGLGMLGTEGAGHIYFNNKTSIPTALTRAGLAGVATLGVLTPIERRLYRSAKTNTDKMRVKEASSMPNIDGGQLKKYAGTEFKDFVNTAVSIMGPSATLVPRDTAYAAFELYTELPEKTAAEAALGLYNQVLPGMNKVAMEMVAANIVAREKSAAIAAGAKMIGKGAASFAGKAFEPTLTGASIYSTTKDRMANDRGPYQQGKSLMR